MSKTSSTPIADMITEMLKNCIPKIQAVSCCRAGEARQMNPEISAALNEVLLQAALRAERANQIREADRRAAELARRMDNREEQRSAV